MAATTSNKPLPGTETVVKQEKLDDSHIEIGEIQTEGFPPFQGTFKFAEEEAAGPSEQIDEPPPKRARRAAATRKPVQMSPETDEEDDVEALEAVTKVEDESESEGEAGDDGTGEVDEPEPAFVDVPSASIVDDQPGPSGLGKDGVVPPEDDPLKPEPVMTEMIITCSKCFETFDNPYLYMVHILIHADGPTIIKCPLCNSYFQVSKEKNNLLQHLNKHNCCAFCGKIYDTAVDLQQHECQLEDVGFECVVCKQLFEFPHYLELHQIWSHTVDLRDGVEFSCKLCMKTCDTIDALINHCQTHQNDLAALTFNCRSCGVEFQSAHDFGVHEREHSRVLNTIYCPFCSFSTDGSRDLRRHLDLVHYSARGFCDICSEFIGANETLQTHIKSHVHCLVCERSFKSVTALKVHKLTHNVTNEYRCKICNEVFQMDSELTSHMRKHHFICVLCDKTYTKKVLFDRHMKTHAGKKPYECKVCNKGYIFAGSFFKHMATHEES